MTNPTASALVGCFTEKHGRSAWTVLHVPNQAEPTILGRLLYDNMRVAGSEDLLARLEMFPPLHSLEEMVGWEFRPPKEDPYPIADWVYLVGGSDYSGQKTLGIYKTIPKQYATGKVSGTGVAWKDGFINVAVADLTLDDPEPDWEGMAVSFRKFLKQGTPKDPLEQFQALKVAPPSRPVADTLVQSLREVISR